VASLRFWRAHPKLSMPRHTCWQRLAHPCGVVVAMAYRSPRKQGAEHTDARAANRAAELGDTAGAKLASTSPVESTGTAGSRAVESAGPRRVKAPGARLATSLSEFGYRSRPRHLGRFGPLGMVIATVCVVLAAFGAGLIIAVYDGVTARDVARMPVTNEEASDPPLLYGAIHDRLITTGEEISIVYVIPRTADAPTPSGVDAWPGEGEVLLSPALAETGRDEGIATRYGTVVGEIGSDGLASPTEKLAYIHPRHEIADTENDYMYQVFGFGARSNGGWLADAVEREPLLNFLLAYSFTVGLGAFLLAWVAVRIGLAERRADATALLTLGATTRERSLWQAGKVWRPLTLGTILGIACCIPWFIVDIDLPGRDFIVQARDVRAASPKIAILTLGAVLLFSAWVLLLSAHRPRAFQQNRPVDRPVSFSGSRAIACLVFAAVAAGMLILANKAGSVIFVFGFVVFLVAVLSTQRDLLGMILAWCAILVRRRGHAKNDAGRVIGAAGLSANARAVSGAAVVLSSILIIASQTFMVVNQLDELASESRDEFSSLEGRVIHIAPMPGADTSQTPALLDSLENSSPGVRVLISRQINNEDGSISLALSVSDDSLASVTAGDLEGTDEVVADYIAWLTGGDLNTLQIVPYSEMRDGIGRDYDNWDIQYEYGVLAVPGQVIDEIKVEDSVAAHTAPMWPIHQPGGNVVSSAARQVGWLVWLGVIGLAFALCGVLVQLTQDTAVTARRLAPTTVLAGSPGMLRKVCIIRVCMPPLISMGIGLLFSIAFCSAFAMNMSQVVSRLIPFAIAACVVAAVIVFFGWLSALYSSRRALNTWKVGSR